MSRESTDWAMKKLRLRGLLAPQQLSSNVLPFTQHLFSSAATFVLSKVYSALVHLERPYISLRKTALFTCECLAPPWLAFCWESKLCRMIMQHPPPPFPRSFFRRSVERSTDTSSLPN